MANAKTAFLNKREEDLIHKQSIRTLEEMGVKIHSQSVLRLLDAKGATVDYDAMTALLPEKMVEEALETAPKSFTFYARDPKHNLTLPSHPYPYSTTSGLSPFVSDFRTGEYRSATRKDIAEFSKLADALKPVDYLWTSMTPADVPPLAHGPHELWMTMQNTTKHVQGVTVQSTEDANVLVELAALVAGGKETLKKHPLMSVIACPIAPLSFERGSVEAQVEFAKAGVPICSMSMSIGGLNAPVTVAGMITNANTENLASIVISQAASAGCPHVYTSESLPMNLRTGCIDYSALEKGLVSIGLGQMAKRYGLPCLVADLGFGSDIHGGVADFTGIATTLMGTASYTDLVTGMGSVDDAKGISFEQLVIDAYIWECLRESLKEVEISEETIGLDVVKTVGHGGDFLTSRHTVQHMRKELTRWDKNKLEMLAKDTAALIADSKEIIRRLLKDHIVPPIDESIIRQGDEIIRAYEKRVGGG